MKKDWTVIERFSLNGMTANVFLTDNGVYVDYRLPNRDRRFIWVAENGREFRDKKNEILKIL